MFQFFRTLFETDSESSSGEAYYTTSAVRRAIASLLIEVARADSNEKPSKRRFEPCSSIFFRCPAMKRIPCSRPPTRWTCNYASPIYRDHRNVKSRSTEQVVEMMWAVAYADGVKDANEEYLIRKVADLLHVSQAHFVRGRQRVQAAMGAE